MGLAGVRRLHPHRIEYRPLTSDLSESADTAGGTPRISEHSRPSFSFNKRRRSTTERVRATSSGDMIMSWD